MRWLLPLALIAAPCVTFAQETEAERTDRGTIVAFLEDNLSGAGRQITLRGFQGALSSRASATQLTIADEDGIWLTLNDIVLDWSRSSLLSGQVSINELTAAEIIIARAPLTNDATPSPEAKGFALPELPVSVEISKISAARVVLGEALLGQTVEGSIEASVSLAGGDGSADLTINRTDDGPDGRIDLSAFYANATTQLSLSLNVVEDAGGIAATLLDLPGTPAVTLQISGEGPLDNFASTIALTSDGAERLTGTVTLTGTDAGGTLFNAELGGDLAPLFVPEYADFLGDTVSLNVTGQRSTEGRLDLSALDLRARSVELRGQALIAADGLPELIALNGFLRDPDNNPVLIPGFDAGVSVRTARLEVAYNAGTDESWRAVVEAENLITPEASLGRLDLRGSGRISRTPVGRVIGGTLTLTGSGIALQDPNLAMAIGDAVTASTRLFWQEGTGVTRIGALDLIAGPVTIAAGGEIAGLSDGFRTRGRISIDATDLAPLSGLAGRPLSGRGTISAAGQGSPLAGDFDVQGRIDGQNLTVDIAQADNFLRGPSSIAFDVRRDTTGTVLRSFALRAPSLAADGSGTLTSDTADLSLTLRMDDLSRLGPEYGGSIAGDMRLSGPLASGQALIKADLSANALRIGQPEVDRLLAGASQVSLVANLIDNTLIVEQLTVTAPGASASAAGTLASTGSDVTAQLTLQDLSRLRPGLGGQIAANATFKGTADTAALTLSAEANGLRTGQTEADRLLTGTSQLSAALRLEGGTLRVDDLRLTSPQITAQATGRLTDDLREVDLTARLVNLGILLPEFPGPVTLSGTAIDTGNGSGYTLSLAGTGPGSINARVAGQLAASFASANLTIQGTAQAGLANPFLGSRVVSGPLSVDLSLNGPLALSSLSGRVGLSGGNLADPSLPFSLQAIDASATLSGGSAQIATTANVSTGGRLSLNGPINLTAPYRGDLALILSGVVLRDPQLYETLANGQLRINGPLAGGALISGRIALPQTEIRIAATGLGGQEMLDGLQHINEPAAVRETRRRAGLIADPNGTGRSTSARPFDLDIEISAPNQLFIRGRGLDAELGGTLRLAGTTANIIPSGAFNLIRGRLDILGRRLTLTEASLQLEGNFDPLLRVVASSQNDNVTSSVVIDGSATDPQVSFTSSPQLPQEEVLSQLLFGRRLESLSALQALQLANAVATLAGRGGEGIISRLRQGFGLDDLDVQTSADGTTQLTAGKYLTENVYSEVVVDQNGQSQINLNLDLTDNLTLKGRVGADGNTGIGLFFERDY
ncbi:MAG: translocation/assembly module TamB domain-containing protein [Pseudotabrizicola sp.]|uniref:translocation/assembly module TamB domain-containing protein n=1 Tax=Pseudotabrizicola sp. TaxID=2939647 RepID=UPI0027320DEC|nr:translocation/assembly module TamB domain-containing protein [Pseudotabrizicola sp.]MDP2081826.1 translocation/assembly module TamB domain-containing protein [Pseudotabrizicola sp.]MDZ7573884.1 translocation/assembly module TamB domain-containing protein [Pseudotabrizicola sp.]